MMERLSHDREAAVRVSAYEFLSDRITLRDEQRSAAWTLLRSAINSRLRQGPFSMSDNDAVSEHVTIASMCDFAVLDPSDVGDGPATMCGDIILNPTDPALSIDALENLVSTLRQFPEEKDQPLYEVLGRAVQHPDRGVRGAAWEGVGELAGLGRSKAKQMLAAPCSSLARPSRSGEHRDPPTELEADLIQMIETQTALLDCLGDAEEKWSQYEHLRKAASRLGRY